MRSTRTETAPTNFALRAKVLIGLSTALLLAALAPVPAAAQDGGSNACTTEVRATQDSRVASITVDCGEESIANVHIDPSDQGTIEPNSGTSCEEVGNDEYDCQPEGGGSVISVRFNDEVGDVCVDPRLNVTFDIELESGETERVDNQEVSGCNARSDTTRDSHGSFDDHGSTPRGGVDSGGGGTALPSVSTGLGAAVPSRSLAVPFFVIALLTLGSTGAAYRRLARR